MATFQALKDPSANLDYAIDWSEWLVGTDTIATSVWSVPIALTTSFPSHGTATTIIWLSGGTAGEVYDVHNTITSAAGRIDERTIEFTCVVR